MAFRRWRSLPERGIRPEWTDRRIIVYSILIFAIFVNIYGALFLPEASEVSLISRICMGSLDTISLVFTGYVVGRLAEKHPSLSTQNADTSPKESPSE